VPVDDPADVARLVWAKDIREFGQLASLLEQALDPFQRRNQLRLVRSWQPPKSAAISSRERASIAANISRPRPVRVRMICRPSLFYACLLMTRLASKLFSIRLR
jgi:hypothetical protein